MEKDPSKQIFFACDDPNELPRAFSLKQAQLLSNPDAMEILAKNIINYLANILNAGMLPITISVNVINNDN